MNTSTLSHGPGPLRRGVALLVACASVFSSSAWANPTGAHITNGQVTMVTNGNQLVVTNTPGAIINWQNFSIGAGETTRFIQQNAQSSVLNRVVGQDPSQILGALQSNGKVFLINPNGIVFGAGARVDVQGLVASSLKLSNDDFAAGKLQFSGDSSSASVHNQGTITTPSGGQVYLIAPNVTNSGLISSPGGDVLLAAGRSVQIADTADPHMRVVLSAANDQALNIGDILARGGNVGIYGALVRQRGRVSANSAVRTENGQIVFKASGDAVLEAGSQTSTSGGAIVISADNAVQVDGSVASNGGAIALSGDTVSMAAGSVDPGMGTLTVQRGKSHTIQIQEPPPAPPTLDQCVATPTLAGCDTVLPSIATCIAEPALVACRVVLPSLSTCVAAPSTLGCSAVLPTVSACIANPAAVGCSAVLPSINACVASPTLPGCSVVLPSIAACSVTPTLPGCAVVLPSVSLCTLTPSTPGCSAVLPTLSACIAAPATPGCTAVLPTLSTCTSNPALPGCGAVLPSLTACISNPAAPGCTVVLPNLSTCASTPTLPGCSVVLPTLAACVAAPSLPGCGAILPSLAQCTATPTLPGCTAVLPPINACLTNPTLAGCTVVSPNTPDAPTNVALNNTVNLINTVTPNKPAPVPVLLAGPVKPADVAPSAATDKKEEKKEEKKDDKKDVVAAKDTGAKYEEPAKKLYCN